MAAISTDCAIRAARPEEADALTDLVFRSKQSNGYDDAFMAACADELRVTPDMLNDDFVVASRNDLLLGCAALRGNEVKTFFIAPEAKRQGVGRALWAELLRRARANDVKRLRLDADPEAVPFYEAMGFVVTGQAPSGSIPGRFIPAMERAL